MEICAKITGRVQGVGFRVTVRQAAIRLGIVGTVKNLEDGSVEIHAFGDKEVIQEMLTSLKKINTFISISDIDSKEIIPQKNYQDFKIIY